MKTNRLHSTSKETLQRSSIAALTAMIMASGLRADDFAADPSAEPTKLPELEVQTQRQRTASSPKFTAPILDTPQTVSIIPKEVFTQQGATNLSDVLRNTPGITFLAGEGGNASSADGDSFYLRGFDATGSIFIDGVRDTAQYNRDVFNVEQVEVAKGPAGSEVGRTTAGGYVNLSTKTPRLEQFSNATLSYDSGEKTRATVDVNQPVGGTSTAAFRLNAMWQEGGVIGRDVTEENRFSLAPSFALGLGTPTRVRLAYQHTKHDDIPDYGLTRAAMPISGGADSFAPVPPAVSQETFYGSVQDFDDVENDTFLARVEHDLQPDVQLSNQTRLSQTDRKAFLTAPTGYTAATGLVTRARQGNQRENASVSNLTNLDATIDTGALKHSISSGFEYLYEKQLTTSYSSTQGTAPATALYDPNLPAALVNPNHNLALLDPVPSGASNWGGIETLALYAFDTIQLSSKWQATGGLRWEKYDAKFRSTATTGVATRIATDDSIVSWKLGINYKPATNGSIYLAYGTSVRPPGANFSASTTGTSADNVFAKPQEAENYELGTKWELFNRKLITTLAVFQSKNTNVSVATDPVTGDPIQTGDQEVSGIEAGVSGNINENWLVFGGFALLDTENTNPTTGATNDGAALQWTPRLSGNLWTTYRLPFGLTVGGGAQYMDKTARQTTNTPAAALPETPDYWLFNAVATYPVTKNVTVRLNVNNLFDEFYIQSLNNNANRYNPGAPRSYVLSAELKF